jgi:group I intron endonuclease
MEQKGIIYRAYDSQGKSYIGQTTRGLEKRKNEHLKSKIKDDFHISLKTNEFKWEILEDNIPEYKLLEREKFWAEQYNSCKDGYNGKTITIWRNCREKGKHISEESKKKISNTLQGNTCALGHSLSEEKRKEIGEKVSKALKGKPKSKEHAKKVANANRGRKASEETKAKLREAWKKRKGEI